MSSSWVFLRTLHSEQEASFRSHNLCYSHHPTDVRVVCGSYNASSNYKKGGEGTTQHFLTIVSVMRVQEKPHSFC